MKGRIYESQSETSQDGGLKAHGRKVIVLWYLLFGMIHEVAHVAAAWWLGYNIPLEISQQPVGNGISAWLRLAYEVALGRQLSLPNFPEDLERPVRHAGWICSCLLLLSLVVLRCTTWRRIGFEKNDINIRSSNTLQCCFSAEIMSSDMLMAALITAFEAITSDLIGFSPSRNPSSMRHVFYCGNFGIILLSHLWLKNKENEAAALDTMQQMIEVTMMRGAQSGGVVVYHPERSKDSSATGVTPCSKAVRSRIVNRKRTDLSKLVRAKVEKDFRRGIDRSSTTPKTFVPRMFVGHTRFATSSLSTLDGTHPHQWTPPALRRVYAMGSNPTNKNEKLIPTPATVCVQNYITHNGDFDFYQSHGKTYELETIQEWLSVVTETKTPASVDSCAIAGMVDILRTQGCFGLSARYALVLGMESSNCRLGARIVRKGDKPRNPMPSYKEYLQDIIGVAFERVLEDFCSENGVTDLPTISNNEESRAILRQKAWKEFRSWGEERISPLLEAMNVRMATPSPKPAAAGCVHNMVEKKKHQIVITEDEGIHLGKEDNSSIVANAMLTHEAALATEGKTTPMSSCFEEDSDDIESNLIDKSLRSFCKLTIDAFFDNDLFMTTKLFMKNAKGSFGISVSSNLDSHRQICLAARGQTVSIAFYPDKDLICYGSEQAAVKAGMCTVFEGESENEKLQSTTRSNRDIDKECTRLDLDDLGGEIVVLDWGSHKRHISPVSLPNHHLQEFHLMNGKVSAILHQESKATKTDSELYHRMTKLSGNPLVKTLQLPTNDPVLTDIQDIPRVCKDIQDDWASRKGSSNLNRLTAFNLSQCLRKRLERHVAGTVPDLSIDILVTGCEVSLYLAEQFASDLQKSFPKLSIEAVSSNKLLGIYGQEIAVPSLGFPYSPQTRNINDSIIIIVSHSGGTFGPLACSNLLQSATQSIFVVTSEWDTQIGKQLRMMGDVDGTIGNLLNQRIFSTEIGMRPAEPCSVSVVATHQLLTNIFEYICVLVLSDSRFRRVTKAQINEQDLKILERCNQMNVNALTEIVGYNVSGYPLDRISPLLNNLFELGNLWSDHILEQVRSYIFCFLYIFATVTSGWPLISALGHAFGVVEGETITYFLRFLDSCIYFWLPQICITIIRIVQGRNLRHRMVGRTVVIGDIPWVSQCADAFLSKCFAVSYSIAGLNVLSGNPSDHFVHRHTHRVVRGTLAIFGRPDGRLSALSTAETSVCLSVNQASSIQSFGGTCESITIGHNPFTLNLSKAGIFLKRHRPLFLCERLLVENDAHEEKTTREMEQHSDDVSIDDSVVSSHRNSALQSLKNMFLCCNRSGANNGALGMSIHHMMDCSISLKIHKYRSSNALVGAYLDINDQQKSGGNLPSSSSSSSVTESIHDVDSDESHDSYSVDDIVAEAIRERKSKDRLHILFETLDKDGDGFLTETEFINALTVLDPSLTEPEARIMFHEADNDHSGALDYNEFVAFLRDSGYAHLVRIPPSNRDKRGLIKINASREKYFGETLRKYNAGKNKVKDMDFVVAQSQHLVQELYETRIASMQRFVAMCVFFHHISKRVESFFAKISFGLWAYRIDRTHSIVRIATTASPISGSDVRQRIERLRLWKKVRHSVYLIEVAYLEYRDRKGTE